MKATGIVRRIDDLGRVVIPKEIRRTMRIREGDPLEIFTKLLLAEEYHAAQHVTLCQDGGGGGDDIVVAVVAHRQLSFALFILIGVPQPEDVSDGYAVEFGHGGGSRQKKERIEDAQKFILSANMMQPVRSLKPCCAILKSSKSYPMKIRKALTSVLTGPGFCFPIYPFSARRRLTSSKDKPVPSAIYQKDNGNSCRRP